jgi:hypothetical protein
VAIHHAAVTSNPKVRFIDFNSLTDAVGLASVLNNHTSKLVSIDESPVDRSQREHNAIELTNCMKDLKLSFCPLAQEIVGGTQCTMATTVCYLYETLPHYLPSATIEFATSLRRMIQRSISLTNPSKTEIMYRAIIEGDNSFTIPKETMVVGPNQTVEFPVQFTPRTVRPVTARLSLIPSRPRVVSPIATADGEGMSGRSVGRSPQYSAPVVVDLVSAVKLTDPDQSLEIEAQLYQTASLKISVKNSLKIPTKLSIFSQAIRIADENGKSIGQEKTAQQQMTAFINDPNLESDEGISSVNSPLSEYIKKHQSFWIDASEIEFTSDNDTVTIELEFTPITLGTFRYFVLFINQNVGELIYQIIGRSIFPQSPDLSTFKIKCEAGKKILFNQAIDPINPFLIRALAHNFERRNFTKTERKFKDLVTRRIREFEAQ